MFTVALIGKYNEEDLIYALNSIMGQENCEIELIISMDELDISICDVINSINGNRKSNLKKIMIHAEPFQSNSAHMSYISKNMGGDYLLCLWNGAALYAKDSLSKSLEDSSGKDIVEGTIVQYNSKQEYAGEKNGGILFPKQFVKSEEFISLDIQYSIKEQVIDYLQKYKNYTWKNCKIPLLKSYRDYNTPDRKEHVSYILNQELPEWKIQLSVDAFKMNYSDYTELTRNLKDHSETKQAVEKFADKLIEYIITKQHGSKWAIKDSEKAYLCHLQNIKSILNQRLFWRPAIKKYIEKIRYDTKKKAVFVVSEYSLWKSCYKSVYDILTANNYKVDIVYVPFKHNKIEIDLDQKTQEWKQSGYSYYGGADYNLSTESPDIIFFCKPYDVTDERWCIKEIEKVMRWIIFIPYIMATMRTGNEIKRLMFQLPMHYISWRQIVYSKTCQKMLEEYSYNSKNGLAIGHPKYDITVTDLTPKETELYHRIKENAGNRKCILWNSHFAIAPQDIDGAGTFFEFGIQFLEHIVHKSDADDYSVVWRPHPMFWDNIKEYPCINQIETLIEEGKQNGRLLVDRSDSQWPAIFAADILVSDASSLIESWIIYNKPLILTMRYMAETPMDDILHRAISLQELKNSIHDVLQNGDVFYEKRKKWLNENYYIPSKGESVAKRLLEEIEREIFAKVV